MKKNIRFVISYDGTRYYGWEKQKTTDMTIQGKLEVLLTKMTNSVDSVTVIGAGRTDAGVHAKAMVCNAFLNTNMSPEEIKKYVNLYLPDDICVLEVKEAGDRFHSRFNALGKTYCYTCYAGNSKPIFDRKYVYTLDEKPNLEAMNKAASYLIGTHDFKSFCAVGAQVKTTVRTIYACDVEKNEDIITIRVTGNGFLYNMVRIIAGTLIRVGGGEIVPEQIPEILAACDRGAAGPTAPAHGLTMMGIVYEDAEENQE